MTTPGLTHLPLTHPMADVISIAYNGWGYSVPMFSVELAFFYHEEWQAELITDFAQYDTGRAGNTRVYPYVPITDVEKFLAEYCPIYVPPTAGEIESFTREIEK